MSQLATSQLEELAACSDGAIEVLNIEANNGETKYIVSLDTRGIPSSNKGIRIRARERFVITVGENFPFKPPSVKVQHRRWAGTPHVQWGSSLCLYLAPSVEWNPSDGVRGLIARLNLWLQRAAEGTLDPEGQPLHPPVAYPSAEAGWIIVNPDLQSFVPWADPGVQETSKLVYAWCSRKEGRVDVLEWMTPDETYDRVLAPDFIPIDDSGRPFAVVPALLLSENIGFEYPGNASALAKKLANLGVSEDELLKALTSAGRFNRCIEAIAEVSDKAPTVLILGTPGRGNARELRTAHVVAWRLDDFGERITKLLRSIESGAIADSADEVRQLARDWLGFAKISWMQVYENRPETTRRRDAGSAATWLAGKRVLILGCGALGAPIAEHCVRAGVAKLTVADSGAVTPGIIVRQPYSDADIGFSKAWALADRLTAIRRDLQVDYTNGDVITAYLNPAAPVPDVDLVVDATADSGVRAALEATRMRNRDQWPPVLTALFGHDTVRGVAILSRPGAAGAAHDILRRIAIDARGFAATTWSDVADDLFPDPPRTELFFPEPGCSAPTFTGSAIQASALASSLLWSGIKELANDTQPASMAAVVVRLGDSSSANGSGRLAWPNDLVGVEESGEFEVRISQRAIAEMRAETRRGLRIRGPRIETGGMLLGSIDEAMNVIYVDVATGPSPDSALSDIYFSHGVEGTQEIVADYRTRTRNRVGFIGMWHTHPYGPARPSPIDIAGMGWLVSPDGTGKNALMMILGGDATRWKAWCDTAEPPNVYARLVRRPNSPYQDNQQASRMTPPTARYYPGGYRYIESTQNGEAYRWWQLIRRSRA
ncbi:hypothetical protein IFM12275_40920 [Nocardia sputorum]|uniref:ThiF family adenylyltransferase n=1 Tax=Nocardia TaxID=1817 RepID=UPI0024561F52|nr:MULTISPECIES: ThiF family adenylyltransferase [Nocardia]BDT94116.1 hypothetical protein IFM12275_40920 [Nocardia sputorum]